MSTVDSNMPYMTFSEFSENGWGSFSKSRWTRPIDPTGSRCLQDRNSSLSGSRHLFGAFEHALRVTYRAWFLKKNCNLSGHLGAGRACVAVPRLCTIQMLLSKSQGPPTALHKFLPCSCSCGPHDTYLVLCFQKSVQFTI